MKGFIVGIVTVIVALTAGLGLGMYAMYSTAPVPKQQADAFVRREPPKVAQPETTGIAISEPRLAKPNPTADLKATEISAAQKKKDQAAGNAERKKAERRQGRQEARKREARRKARDAYASDNSHAQPQHDYGSFGFR